MRCADGGQPHGRLQAVKACLLRGPAWRGSRVQSLQALPAACIASPDTPALCRVHCRSSPCRRAPLLASSKFQAARRTMGWVGGVVVQGVITFVVLGSLKRAGVIRRAGSAWPCLLHAPGALQPPCTAAGVRQHILGVAPGPHASPAGWQPKPRSAAAPVAQPRLSRAGPLQGGAPYHSEPRHAVCV